MPIMTGLCELQSRLTGLFTQNCFIDSRTADLYLGFTIFNFLLTTFTSGSPQLPFYGLWLICFCLVCNRRVHFTVTKICVLLLGVKS